MTQGHGSIDATGAALTISLDGTITACSDAGAALFGCTPDQLVGTMLGAVLPAFVDLDESSAFARVRCGEAVGLTHLIAKTPGGEEVHAAVEISPVRDAQDAVCGASLVARRLAPEELTAHARGHLAAIVESSDDAIISHTVDRIITSWNKGAEHLLGYRASEALGRSVMMIAAPENGPLADEVLGRVHRGETISHFTTDRIHKDGSRVRVSLSVSPIRDDAGRIVGAASIARDMGEREQAEEAQARLAAIVDSSVDAIVSKTTDGTITSWNQAAERMFGYTSEEAIGRSILLIIPAERHAEEEMVLASIRRGDILSHFETVRLRKDGSRIDVSLTVSPVKDPSGRIIGASKIARDISDRKRAEEERASLLHEAQEANRAKDQFLAMLGHELRNPLGAIMTALGLLEQVGASDPIALRARAVGMRQTQHLAKLVDDLLDVGRVMAGKLVVHPEPVDLGEAVRAYMTTLRAAGRLDAHRVSVEARPVTVSADPARLDQIIANLVSNALRYTPADRQIRVFVERVGGEAILGVEDEGIGIPPELLPNVFDLFVQSERRIERTKGGLGIGLTLVRRLTELQGGSVAVESEGVGRGSRFAVRLPVLEERTSTSAPAPERTSPHARRVLVVEDGDDAREMLRMLLEREGHEVYEAADGRAGVDAALRLRPDVALVDIGLPKLDGYAVARTIRGELGQTVLLVAVTGYGSEKDRDRALEAGFDIHVRKPIERGELTAVLKRSPGAPELHPDT